MLSARSGERMAKYALWISVVANIPSVAGPLAQIPIG